MAVCLFCDQSPQQNGWCRPENCQEKIKAHGAVFSVQAVFAMWYIVGHIVLRENDPLTFALTRELLSASALVVLAQRFEGQIKVKSRRDVGDIILLVSSLPACCNISYCGSMQPPAATSALTPQHQLADLHVRVLQYCAFQSFLFCFGPLPVCRSSELNVLLLQGLMCYAVVMGFMFALSDLPEVTVAIAQPLVPALALGMSAVLGIEMLSYVSLGGIVISIAGTVPVPLKPCFSCNGMI